MLSAPWTLGRRTVVRGLLALAIASCTGAVSAYAAPSFGPTGQPAPIIDGNGDDLIAFAAAIGANGCAIDRTDPRDDVAIDDPKIIVCATKEDTNGDAQPDYFINGFDMRRFVFVYDRPAQTVYLLWRTEGFIGDVDGNTNPDDAVCPPTIPSFGDEPGIGSQENYQSRIDTNCDGLPDITISVGGSGTDQITVTGTTSGTKTLAYRAGPGTGKDLEVRITNIALPVVFRVNANSNASFDGLGEDITPTTECGVAIPNISIEKSVEPAVICPGQTADFTLLVTNTGNVDLTNVTVVDNLPAPLDFVSTVSNTCGGAVNNVGDQITYGPFSLAAGASCTIVIRVSRTAECQGEQTNNASVEGTFSSPCVNNGQPIIVSDKDSATLVCGNIQCSIEALDTLVCPGEQVEICGPVGNFSYAWSNGQTTRCITVGAGTFSLVITNTETGCVSDNSCSVTIVENPRPVCSIEALDRTVCGTETVEICGPVGPYTYLWSNGQTTRCINVGVGTFTLVITNTETGCVSDNTCSVTITPETPPCVNVTVNDQGPLCVGATFDLCGTVENCGDRPADLQVRYLDLVRNFPAVPNGESRNYCFEGVVMPACTGDGVVFTVRAVATNNCGSTPEDTASDTVPCANPQIDVEKVAQETQVPNGGTIHYTITVRNPSATVALENIRVIDDLCAYARWTGVANPAPFSAPAVGTAGGVVEWRFASLAPGAQEVITFEVTADVAAGGGTCPTTVQCQNDVVATGECLGSNGQSTVRDEDTITTPIVCASDNCPRTVGFWGAQCAQRGNGSTKFTEAQLTQIARCVDDESDFFDWAEGTDLTRFCQIINPTSPMQQRKQAKRQFAGVLANLCTDLLNLQPSQGGRIFLDPNTPISCPGLDADTIGELIDEVDDILADLEGEDLNDPDVKARYGQLIACLDGINNGINIPTSADCEHGTTTPSDEGTFETDGASVELYRPFPNPFSGSTSFAYSVEGNDGANVDITVYDVAGRQIRKLVSGVQAAGRHTAQWDGRTDSGAKANRGVYFVRTVIGGVKAATNRVLYLSN